MHLKADLVSASCFPALSDQVRIIHYPQVTYLNRRPRAFLLCPLSSSPGCGTGTAMKYANLHKALTVKGRARPAGPLCRRRTVPDCGRRHNSLSRASCSILGLSSAIACSVRFHAGRRMPSKSRIIGVGSGALSANSRGRQRIVKVIFLRETSRTVRHAVPEAI